MNDYSDIQRRVHFVNLINQKQLKIGAELGVAAGWFSGVLAKSKLQKLYLIDKWNDHHTLVERDKVLERFKNDSRVTVLHKTFNDALLDFEDNYFDFIYIDGYAHTGQDNGNTLRAWYSKLKIGGVYAGHDYVQQFPKTIKQVDTLAKTFNKSLYFTSTDPFPSWFFIK